MPISFEPEYFDAASSGITPKLNFDTGSGLLAVGQDTLATNPLQSFLSSEAVEEARGNRGFFERKDFRDILGEDGTGVARGRTYISLEEQSEIIRENQLQNFLKPTFGETRESLDLIIELKKQELTRNFIVANSNVGLTGQISVGLLASLVDPINIGSAFVPIIGSARYAGMLAKQASRLGRASVRARTGAVEGAVGALAVEPLVYYSQRNVQADYDLYDSFANLAFGAGFGAGLRTGGGLIGDILNNPKSTGIERSFAQQAKDAGPEAQADIMRATVGQMADGRAPKGVDVMLRQALESKVVGGRIADDGLTGQSLETDQPIITRGDYLIRTDEAGRQQKVPAITVRLDDNIDVEKFLQETEGTGIDVSRYDADDGTPKVDAKIPDDFLLRNDEGEHITHRTKKEASKAATQAKKAQGIKKIEPVKIADKYYLATADNPKGLELLKKNLKTASVAEFLPPVAGRVSTDPNGQQHFSVDIDRAAEEIKRANSDDAKLFTQVEQEAAELYSRVDVDDITPEQIETEIANVRAELERSGEGNELNDFDVEQAERQKDIDDIKEQEAAFKDAIACGIGNKI